jgi:integrase
MGRRELAGRSREEGRGKRAVWSWIGRHSYHWTEQNVKDEKLDHREKGIDVWKGRMKKWGDRFNFLPVIVAEILPGDNMRSYETYRSVITRHLKPSLGHIRLQQLQPTDLKGYYTQASLAPATLEQHHIILHSALKAALMQGLVSRNVATLVIGKPRRKEGHDDVLKHCWSAEEAQRFLVVTHTVGPQMEAFYHLALDTGARKAELCGLRWHDVDLVAGLPREH